MHVQQIPLPGALLTGEELAGSGTIQSFLNVFHLFMACAGMGFAFQIAEPSRFLTHLVS